jgi:hypothetical protein
VSALQAWLFLAALAVLAARGLDRTRLTEADLAVIGWTAALAIVQRVLVDQVTLDDTLVAPLLVAAPIVVGARRGLRAGLAAALGGWVAVTVVASTVPTPAGGEIPQEAFALATVFAALTAGAAAALRGKPLAVPILAMSWALFFASRDASLLFAPAVLGVLTLATAWSYVGLMLVPAAEGGA